MSDRPGYVDYEVTYPMGFVVSVEEGADEQRIAEAWAQAVWDWSQEGNLPVIEFLEIKRLSDGFDPSKCHICGSQDVVTIADWHSRSGLQHVATYGFCEEHKMSSQNWSGQVQTRQAGKKCDAAHPQYGPCIRRDGPHARHRNPSGSWDSEDINMCDHEGCDNEAIEAYTPDDDPEQTAYACKEHITDAGFANYAQWVAYREEEN